MEDSKIVQLYLERDEDAIRQTSDKYGNMLRNISYSMTADYHMAEECENDTYMEAWRRIPPNDPREYLASFLIRIVRHISLDRCRANSALKREGHILSLSKELE